jgi:hypothetical protein
VSGPPRDQAGTVALVREDNLLRVGDRFTVAFQRTLRIPEDGRVYPLPPGLGRLPLVPAAELAHAPAAVKAGSFVLPLYQREALWLGFGGASWKPNAVQIAVGGINAISATAWDQALSQTPQNYLVCPQQPWLDGINAGAGVIRQFVALPLNDPSSIEAQLRGEASVGGIQLRVFEPRPGRFPDVAPPPSPSPQAARGLMGLGAGGKVAQRIHPDPFGLDTWDPESATTVIIHLVNSQQFEAMTGRPPPPSPIDAATYTERGFPWFERYDEAAGTLPAASGFAPIVPSGGPDEHEVSVAIDPSQIEGITPKRR